jgi:hypothetical protein
MHMKKTKLMELRMLGYTVAVGVGVWLYIMACWHIPWMSW